MTGLDTNVLVRYITRDESEQYQAANAFLESNCTQEEPGYVNIIVLRELVWVLASAYDAEEHEVRRLLDQLLRTRQLQIEHRDQVCKALQVHTESTAGFVGCLPGQLNQAAGCTQTVTSDQDAAEL